MADKIEVSAKVEIKNTFDKSLNSRLQTAMTKTIQDAVNKSADFKFVSKTSKGFMLTVTLQSLTKKDSPASLEGKIAISGVYMGGSAKAFNASAGGKATATDADTAEDLVTQLLEDLMPKMIKTMQGLTP
jgi:hypothetical protein